MANAFVLATVSASGQPSARVVSYRPGAAGEFRFFTNYHSRKGRELEHNPKLAAVFLWESCGRQVRLEGRAERLSRGESVEYFASRPLEHQVATALSAQSQPLPSPDALSVAHGQAVRGHRVNSSTPSCPEHWGGYQLTIQRIELWTRGGFRLPERRRYERKAGAWSFVYLSP